MAARELEVPAAAAGTRLDAWLAEALGISRAAAAALIDAGAVQVDGGSRVEGHAPARRRGRADRGGGARAATGA